MSETNYDVIVIGTGVTGLSAARDTVTSGLTTATIDPQLCGGLIMNINELDGEPHGSGMDLASSLMMELSELGVTSLSERVISISKTDGILNVETDENMYRARSVIVASGARLKRLGVPGESEFDHQGVSQCADCDGPMFQDEEVVVVGGGDSALQEALVLAALCSCVHIVHRRDSFRAKPRLIEEVEARRNIKPHLSSIVEEVVGDQTVTGVRLRDLKSGDASEIMCSGVFVYIGLEPNSEFLPPEMRRDSVGSLMTSETLETNIAGVFAAGAVRAGYRGMVADAISDAHLAAKGAIKYCREQ